MIDNKHIIGITLARGGSKGIPNKNLAIINNKSLVRRAIETSKSSKYIDFVYLSSDSSEILEEGEKYGAIPLQRPAHLAQDTSSSADTILHAIEAIQCDYIIESMCTSPFKTVEDIDSIIEKLHNTQDSVVGVARILDHHPARVKYIENDILCDFYPEIKESRRQDLIPHAYVRNGSIYAFTRNSLMIYKSRYGGTVRPYIMSDIKSINIDEPMDLEIARKIAEEYNL